MKIYMRPWENISSAATIIPDSTTLHLACFIFTAFMYSATQNLAMPRNTQSFYALKIQRKS